MTLSEAFSYYERRLRRSASFVQSEGVAVWDLDLTQRETAPDERFELITNTAMIEHLANAPRPLMENMRATRPGWTGDR